MGTKLRKGSQDTPSPSPASVPDLLCTLPCPPALTTTKDGAGQEPPKGPWSSLPIPSPVPQLRPSNLHSISPHSLPSSPLIPADFVLVWEEDLRNQESPAQDKTHTHKFWRETFLESLRLAGLNMDQVGGGRRRTLEILHDFARQA